MDQAEIVRRLFELLELYDRVAHHVADDPVQQAIAKLILDVGAEIGSEREPAPKELFESLFNIHGQKHVET